MFRPIVLLSALVTLAGCHAPMPTFQPLAGSGSPRVAPPPTGSYGRPDAYYPGGGSQSSNAAATSEVAVAGNPTATAGSTTTWQVAGSHNSPTANTQPIGSGVAGASVASEPSAPARISRDSLATPTVRQIDFEQPAPNATERSIRIQPSTGGSVAPPLINSMPLNDATSAAGMPPRRFVPTGEVVEISQLPRATPNIADTSRIRGFGVPVAQSSAPSIATAPAPSPATASTGNTVSGGWRSKYTPLGATTR